MAKQILKAGKFVLTGGLVGAGIRALSKKKNSAAPTAPTTERVMPIADDEALKRDARQSFLRRRGSGRGSTILAGGSPGATLGGV